MWLGRWLGYFVVLWLSFLVTALFTLFLTAALRRYALARSLMDVPNARSSHTVPTPRGGGLAIVITCLFVSPLLAWYEILTSSVAVSIVVAGGLVALVGFLDDHGHVAARWRLVAHFTAASMAIVWLGGLPILPVMGFSVDFGWGGNALAAVYMVWLLNLYNFMDGIDGIAGIEAITVCLGAVVLYLLSPTAGSEWVGPMLLLAAVGGFLFWNFPKARIFMGDSGSGFVGLTLGVLSIEAGRIASELFWGWVILLGAFVVDATVTLIRRVLRGEKFYEAHRSHAYQYASRKYGAHPPVSLAFGAINLFWLLPMAALVATGWLDGVLGVLVAYAPLVWLAVRFKAGARELQEV